MEYVYRRVVRAANFYKPIVYIYLEVPFFAYLFAESDFRFSQTESERLFRNERFSAKNFYLTRIQALLSAPCGIPVFGVFYIRIYGAGVKLERVFLCKFLSAALSRKTKSAFFYILFGNYGVQR